MNNRYLIIFIFLILFLPVYSYATIGQLQTPVGQLQTPASNPVNTPVEVYGSNLFGDLLRRPLMTTAIRAGITVAKLHPYIRTGATIAGLLLAANEFRPKNGGEVPSGWRGANLPPLNSDPTTCYRSNGLNSDLYACSFGEFCSKSQAYAKSAYGILWTSSGSCAIDASNRFIAYGDFNGSPSYYPVPFTRPTSCSSGYVSSGGNCLFDESNPANGVTPWPVQPDHDVFQPDSLGGGLWEKSPRQTATPNPNTTVAGTGEQTQTGINPATSQPYYSSLTPQPDGGFKFKHIEQTNDPVTGQTNVTVDSFTTNSYGNITNATTNIFNNTSLSNVVNNSNVIQTNVDVSSLAKDATLQETNSKLDTIKDKLKKDESEFQVIPDVRSIPDSLSLVFDSIKSKFNPPTFSDSVSSCPVWSQTIPYLNVPFVIDELCLWEPKLRPIISSVMFAVWALLSIKILLSA